MGEREKVFSWAEYVVFFGLLSASAAIGIYYAVKPRKKQQTTDDYMLGGRKMPNFPIAMSLIVSFVSGITLLGFPAEMYSYGTQLFGVNIAVFISVILLNLFYLPVFYNLRFKSVYEYLERRFDKKVRTLASFIFAVSLLLYIPVVIYVPSLAFNQVTGVPIKILAPLICSICVFYTSIGGLKAVVWSDALQSIFTIGSMLAVIVIGSISLGGVPTVLRISQEGERLELFNFDPDPFKRNTFWTTVFGVLPIQVNFFSTHPGSVQRYISLPTYRQARMVTIAMFSGIVMIKVFSVFTGLLIYAKYKDCDPVVTQQVTKAGQLLPFYVMDIAENYTGLAGLFLSGVVSTALSTMSTGLNTVAGTIFEDLIRPLLPKKLNDKQTNLFLKSIVVLLGAVCTLMVFVVAQLGTIMQIALTFQGLTAGVSVFLFTFGMGVPWGNTKGVLSGAVAGMIAPAVLATGSHYYTQAGDIKFGRKITTIDSCPSNLTSRLNLNSTVFGYGGEGTKVFYSESVPWMFRISYLYYSMIGFLVSMLVASLVSLATGPQDPRKIDQQLLFPQLRKASTQQQVDLQQYDRVPTSEVPLKS